MTQQVKGFHGETWRLPRATQRETQGTLAQATPLARYLKRTCLVNFLDRFPSVTYGDSPTDAQCFDEDEKCLISCQFGRIHKGRFFDSVAETKPSPHLHHAAHGFDGITWRPLRSGALSHPRRGVAHGQ
ncbi:hypothetical protein GCM10027590_42260 [Nocardiopsis nanhaiensis]